MAVISELQALDLSNMVIIRMFENVFPSLFNLYFSFFFSTLEPGS